MGGNAGLGDSGLGGGPDLLLVTEVVSDDCVLGLNTWPWPVGACKEAKGSLSKSALMG